MKKITVAVKRYGGRPVAAFVSGEFAVAIKDTLDSDVSLIEVPVLDACAYDHLYDLEDTDEKEMELMRNGL